MTQRSSYPSIVEFALAPTAITTSAAVPPSIGGGISAPAVADASFIVSCMAPVFSFSGLYQPMVPVTIGAYFAVMAFPVPVA